MANPPAPAPLAAPPASSNPGPLLFHVLSKPIGPVCNLDCRYCFYLHKQGYFPKGEQFRMSDETVEALIRQYIESQTPPAGLTQPLEVNFAWQGGEPTLLGVDFFRRVVELQRKYAGPGVTISNAFQTNGVLLDDEWCAFLKEHDFLIGLSIDGATALHDQYRLDKQGRPTHAAVMRGLRCLQKQQVRVNSLTCVSRANQARGGEVYRFLRDECGFEHMQFIPIVERTDFEETAPGVRNPASRAGPDLRRLVMPWSVEPVPFGRFMCAVFDEWIKRDVGRVFVQYFEVALAGVLGLPPPLCVFAPTCGRALAIEHDGTLYSCDHFVYPEFRLGNIHQQTLSELAALPFQAQFGQDKYAKLPRQCRLCEFLRLCYGECPKNRFLKTPDGEGGLNYLCAGLKVYFAQVAPALGMMARELRAGRSAVNVMHALNAAPKERREV